MKPSRSTTGAFSLVEMLVVIGIISILAALLLPALSKGMMKARQIQCVSHLRQVGIGFHSFANSHNSRFPMQVPRADGGSQEFVQAGFNVNGNFYFSFRHFQVLSNELVDPRILLCPTDTTRTQAVNFAQLQNQNLSYFVGVTAKYDEPTTMLAGDHNLKDVYNAQTTILRSGAIPSLQWSSELHQFRGNILFSDGHVEESGQHKLKDLGRAFQYYPLVMPDVSPGAKPYYQPPPAGPNYPNYSPQYAAPATATPTAAPQSYTPRARQQAETYSHNSGPAPTVTTTPRTKATPPATSPEVQASAAPVPDFPEDSPAAPIQAAQSSKHYYSYLGLLLLLLALLATWRVLRRKAVREPSRPLATEPKGYGGGYM